ncbi:MAG: hypothetical protein NTX59_09100 [Elusimicrobia bacterium]|nr:hypothetical protein [Elusimicrobiota bacterium]
MCDKTQQPQEVLDLLARDYEKLVLQLTDYALKLIRGRVWRRDFMPSKDDGSFALPGGRSAEDIVLDVFRKCLDGTRNWKQQEYPNLLVVLKGMVKSEISSACTNTENTTTFVPPEPEGHEGAQFEKCIEPHEIQIDHSVGLLQPQEIPQGSTIRVNTIHSEIAGEIQRAARKNPDMVKVIEAIMAGGEKSAEIAEYCDLPVAKVYELKRNLNIIAAKITREVLNKNTRFSLSPGGNRQ